MDLFVSNPVLKRYRRCPPGNIPKLCNIDSYLCEDLHNAVDCNVRYTHSFHKLDPKKLSTATPRKGKPAYLWILDPIDGISSSREGIISDTYDVLISIMYIVEAEGFIIPGVKNVRNVWKVQRREYWGSKETNYRGKSVGILAKDDYGAIPKGKVHKDAHVAKVMQLKLSQQMFNCDDTRGGFDEDRKIY